MLLFFLSYLDLTVVQLNTVAFWGTIADRRDQENVQSNGICSHTQAKYTLGNVIVILNILF